MTSPGTEARGGASPNTPTSISRPTIASSATIHSSNSNACVIAASNSTRLCGFETPTEEPMFAGFTKQGRDNSCSTRAANSLASPLSLSSRYRACGRPAALNARFIITLSMPTADPSTPDPTYGSPANSNKPCTVPSSPYGPCSNGSTTSTASDGPDADTNSARPGSDGNSTGVPATSNALGNAARAPSNCATASSASNHRPSVVIATGTTS